MGTNLSRFNLDLGRLLTASRKFTLNQLCEKNSMKRLNSLILATCVLLSSGLVGNSLPVFSAESQMNVRNKGAVKAEVDSALKILIQKLNLTASQQGQAQTIFSGARQSLLKVLTPDQLKKLKAGGTFKSLNLTAAQEKTILGIMIERRKQFSAILTPSQKKTFDALTPPKK